MLFTANSIYYKRMYRIHYFDFDKGFHTNIFSSTKYNNKSTIKSNKKKIILFYVKIFSSAFPKQTHPISYKCLLYEPIILSYLSIYYMFPFS